MVCLNVFISYVENLIKNKHLSVRSVSFFSSNADYVATHRSRNRAGRFFHVKAELTHIRR
jgi:hypothetical protein